MLNYKSPYKIKYGKKPNLENIKIWGSIAYNRIDNAKKLDKRAKPYILVGYNSNQYKLLDLKTKRVVWSRDVTILEGIFPSKWKNTEDYDINDYINTNNNYEIIIDNAITSHIPFKGAVNVDRAENQSTNQQIECDIPFSENNTQNTQDESNINDITSASNANSHITSSEFDEFDELNSEVVKIIYLVIMLTLLIKE